MQKSSAHPRPLPTIVAALIALIATLVVLPLALASRADAFIYWTRGDGISRANLDGTGVDQLFITSARSTPRYFEDLAVDEAHVYWTTETDRIGRANLDGTGVDEGFITGAGGGFGAGSVAVDAEHVYWTHYQCGPGPADETQCTGAIGRADLDGTAVDPGFIDGIIPLDVAVYAGHLYWANYGYAPTGVRYAIGRADLDGTDVNRDLVNAFSDSLTGVAVAANHVYWGEYGTSPPTSSIGRADLDGTDVEHRFIGTDDNQGLGFGPEVFANHVYWGIRPAFLLSHEPDAIGRANLDGTGAGRFIDGASTIVGDIAVDRLTDTKLAGKASAPKTQEQTGKKISIKVTVKAEERLTARAGGKITINAFYKLKPKTIHVGAGKTKSLKLKPKREGQAEKIAKALRQGDKANAKLKVKLTDQAGNSETEQLRVRLKRA